MVREAVIVKIKITKNKKAIKKLTKSKTKNTKKILIKGKGQGIDRKKVNIPKNFIN